MARTETRDPFSLFATWFDDATEREPRDPNAMALATADAQGRPSVRMVLLKGFDQQGFVFYTNSESQKGTQLAVNPQAALCFYWKSLQRQVRVEGNPALHVELLSRCRTERTRPYQQVPRS